MVYLNWRFFHCFSITADELQWYITFYTEMGYSTQLPVIVLDYRFGMTKWCRGWGVMNIPKQKKLFLIKNRIGKRSLIWTLVAVRVTWAIQTFSPFCARLRIIVHFHSQNDKFLSFLVMLKIKDFASELSQTPIRIQIVHSWGSCFIIWLLLLNNTLHQSTL